MTAALQEAIDHVLRLRGVEDPCAKCHGLGTKRYGDTSTWRHSMGTQEYTWDVCEVCWGTGDKGRTGVNLKRQEDEEDARVAARALSLVADKAGAGLDVMREGILGVAKELDAMARTKFKPRPPWFSLVAENLARVLREGAEAARKREGK